MSGGKTLHVSAAGEPWCVTEQAFHRALALGNPAAWHNDAHGESFRIEDGDGGAVVYVRINQRHFCFRDASGLAHDACLRRVADAACYRQREDAGSRPMRGEPEWDAVLEADERER